MFHYYLLVGDITEQGFRNKKARLENKYTQTSDSEEPSPISGSQIAESLSKPSSSVQQTIKTLFGRKSSDSLFCPSAITAKCSRQKATQKNLKLPKRVTVVHLEDKMYSVPRRKARDKLIEGGRVKEVLIASSEDEQTIHRKIAAAFSTLKGCDEYEFLHVSSGLDLLKAEFPQGSSSWSGEAVLKLLDGNSLYIKSRNVTVQKKVSSPPVSQPVSVQPQPVTIASLCRQQNLMSSHLQLPPSKYSQKPAAHVHPRPVTSQIHCGPSHIQSDARHNARPRVLAVVVGRGEPGKRSYDTGDRMMFTCAITVHEINNILQKNPCITCVCIFQM